MHIEAQTYITRKAHDLYGARAAIDVVEFGGLDVNGGLRHLYPKANWLSVDFMPGPGVDEVADIVVWDARYRRFDLVICAEVLEHAPDPHGIIAKARSACRQEAAFIVTAACDPRAQHGAYDPDGTYGALPGEHYKNIEPAMLLDWLGRYFTMIEVVVDGKRGDVYACARP